MPKTARLTRMDVPLLLVVTVSIRQKAWPAMLGVEQDDLQMTENLLQDLDPAFTEDLDMIEKDVHRSAMFHETAVAGSIAKGEQQSDILREKLARVLCGATAPTPLGEKEERPNYYQGLHQIAFALLFNLNYDEITTTAVLQRLIQTHLQDATQKNFGNVVFLLDAILLPFLHSLDPEVYQAVAESEVPLTNAILPWMITLFTHAIQDQSVASRLLDAFLAESSKPLLPFYVAVTLLVHPTLRQIVLASTEDAATMHMAIRGLPNEMKNDFVKQPSDGESVTITAQEILDTAMSLMDQHPPECLLGLVGVGLKRRTRRRLVNKVRTIAMVQRSIMDDQASLWMQARLCALREYNILSQSKQFASLRNVLTQTKSTKAASKVMAISKHAWAILQIVVLFILMPQHHVKEFHALMGAWVSPSSLPTSSSMEKEETKENQLSSSSSSSDGSDSLSSVACYHESPAYKDMPRMVKLTLDLDKSLRELVQESWDT